MIRTQLADGHGSGVQAKVSAEGAIYVTQVENDIPEVGTPSRRRFYTQTMHAVGDVNDTNMGTNQSTANPKYFIFEAASEYDIFIMAITIVIADSAVTHDAWGNVNALTNGWSLWVEEQGNVVDIIRNAKTGGELLAQSSFYGMYGNGATANELTNWTGNTDAQTIHIPIGQFIPGGIRIGRGTLDNIKAEVQDDLSGLTLMEVRAFGYTLHDAVESTGV